MLFMSISVEMPVILARTDLCSGGNQELGNYQISCKSSSKSDLSAYFTRLYKKVRSYDVLFYF